MRLFLLLLVAVAVLAVLPLSGAFRTFAPPVAKRGGLGMAATEDQTVTYEKMKAQVPGTVVVDE